MYTASYLTNPLVSGNEIHTSEHMSYAPERIFLRERFLGVGSSVVQWMRMLIRMVAEVRSDPRDN